MSYGLMPMPATPVRSVHQHVGGGHRRHRDGQQGELAGAETEDRRAQQASSRRPAPMATTAPPRRSGSPARSGWIPASRSAPGRQPGVPRRQQRVARTERDGDRRGPRNPASKVARSPRRCRTGPSGGGGPDRGPVGRLGGLGGVADRRFVAVIAQSLEQAAPASFSSARPDLAASRAVSALTAPRRPVDQRRATAWPGAAGRPGRVRSPGVGSISTSSTRSPARRMSMVIPTSMPHPGASGLASSKARRLRQR